MMILTAKVDFKKIMVILLAAAAVLLAIILLFGGKKEQAAQTSAVPANDDRVEFLKEFGWEVTPAPKESGPVRIPEESGEMFRRYNALQKGQGYDLSKGRLRDVIASIMQKSTGKIAQIEKINSNLIPELQKEVREGRLNFSVAHEVSGLSQEKQHELLEKYEKGGLSVKEAKQAKEEEKEEETEEPEESQEEWQQPEENQEQEWEDAHPESITSLCYSCQRYQECNVKTGTCQKCDQYVNKAEAEKTEEDRYNEEQDRLDRESKEKLREREQEERMQQFPSGEQEDKKERVMRVAEKVYKDAEAGRIRHMIVKLGTDQYKEKDVLTMLEFKDGRSTGRQMRVCVTCVDTAETSNAIVDGYAVLGIMDVYDAEQMGLIDLGDED